MLFECELSADIVTWLQTCLSVIRLTNLTKAQAVFPVDSRWSDLDRSRHAGHFSCHDGSGDHHGPNYYSNS